MIYLKKLVTSHYFAEKLKFIKDTVFYAKVIKVIGFGVAYYFGLPSPILRLSLSLSLFQPKTIYNNV